MKYSTLIFILKSDKIVTNSIQPRKKWPIQSYDITLDAERGTMLDKQGVE
jgi:hypothetical protein